MASDFAFQLRSPAEIWVPAASYKFVACKFAVRLKDGTPWSITDRGQVERVPVDVTTETPTKLTFGPPLTVEVIVTQQLSDLFRFDLVIKGRAGEKYRAPDIVPSGTKSRPPPPTYTVRTASGKTVTSAAFGYG